MAADEIRKTIEIDASTEVVFSALTKSDELTQWFPNTAIFEPRVGGKMHFTFIKNHEMKDVEHFLNGEILEYVPNKKLVYTFIPDNKYMPDGIRPPITTVTWNLEEISENKTRVTLIHTGFTKEIPKQFKDTTEGWNFFTARLVQYCKTKSKHQ